MPPLFAFPAALPPEWLAFWGISLFCIGACIGSFLNVCVYRIPLGLSVVRPRSACAACGAPIPARHNLPLFSWLWLRGRSACCQTFIDARYFWVELGSALLLPVLFLSLPWPAAAIDAVFLYGLLTASLIDIDHFLIPDRFTVGGVLAGLAASLLWPPLHRAAGPGAGFDAGLLGAFSGGFFLWLVVVLGSKALKKEAMGLGDVKLLAAIGAFLGWKAVLFVVAVSSTLGSLYGGWMLLRGRQVWGSRLPYGPFLALAALLWICGGAQGAMRAMAWWRHWVGLGEALLNEWAGEAGKMRLRRVKEFCGKKFATNPLFSCGLIFRLLGFASRIVWRH